jgi:hypothetical protein
LRWSWHGGRGPEEGEDWSDEENGDGGGGEGLELHERVSPLVELCNEGEILGVLGIVQGRANDEKLMVAVGLGKVLVPIQPRAALLSVS